MFALLESLILSVLFELDKPFVVSDKQKEVY
jgi:hypothetical protein